MGLFRIKSKQTKNRDAACVSVPSLLRSDGGRYLIFNVGGYGGQIWRFPHPFGRFDDFN